MASKILIVGASGFIGRLLATHLAGDGYSVLTVTRDNIDLRNYTEVKDYLTMHRPDVVINCAIAVSPSVSTDEIYKDIQNNFDIFMNFYNNSELFGKYINIGSGAEFDMTKNVDLAREEDILTSKPLGSYGYSKNIISRLILTKDNFYTIRLFGCFHPTELDTRLLKRCLNSEEILIQNKMFDYISFQDFYEVIKHYVNNQALTKDVNCVYSEKYDLKSIVDKFISFHNLSTKVILKDTRGVNYTGNGDRLAELFLPLKGLDQGLVDYTKG